MWKLFVAVLALQLVCTMQAPMENGGTEMMLKMLMQQMQMQQQGSARDDDDDDHDMGDLIRSYMEEHDIDEDAEPGTHMLYQYTQIMEHVIRWYEMLQGGDLVTKSLLKDLITNPDSPGDFAKTLVLKSIHEMVEPAGEKKKIMAKVFEYLMAHPDGENSEMAKMLLKRLTAGLSDYDKGVLRVMMLHYMAKSRGEHLELLRELLGYLMSDEAAGNMQANEMLLLLIQQYLAKQDFSEDKKTMALMILHGLADRKDKEGRELLRHMITKSILSTNEDQPEDDQWKYYPPGPCLVQRSNGDNVSSHECPHDLACTLGPVNYNFDNTNLRFYMCDYPSRYFPYHACEVTYPTGDVDSRHGNCGEGTCDFGPFDLNADEGQYRVMFCSDYANYTANISAWDPAILRTCGLEDSTGYRSLQRRCPYGTKCGGQALPTKFGNYSLHAYMCWDEETKQGHEKEDFMETVLETGLGFWEETDSEDGGEMPVDNEDFIQYIIGKLWAEQQQGGMDDMEEDPDIKPLKVMAYLVHKMAEDNKLLMKFVENAKIKHHMGILDDADRVFMHGIIRHLLAVWFKEQRGEQRQEGDLEDLMAWMMHMKEKMSRRQEREDESGNVLMRIKQMMMEKHADHHEEMDEKVKMIMKMLMSGGGDDNQGRDDGEERGGEGDNGNKEMEFIKMLIEKLMHK